MFSRRSFFNTVASGIALGQPPEHDEKTRALIAKMGMSEGALKAGDAAPDFELALLKQKTRIWLSSFATKRPVALLFGSFS